MPRKLTDEESRIAAANVRLVYLKGAELARGRGPELAEAIHDAAVDGHHDAARGFDPDRGKFSTLFGQCTRNRAYRAQRDRRRPKFRPPAPLQSFADEWTPEPVAAAAPGDLTGPFDETPAFDDLVAALDGIELEVVRRRYLGREKFEAIARALGLVSKQRAHQVHAAALRRIARSFHPPALPSR